MVNKYKLLHMIVVVCRELWRGLVTGCTILGTIYAGGIIFFRDNVLGSPELFPQTVTFEDTQRLLDFQAFYVWHILLLGISLRVIWVLFHKQLLREKQLG